MGTRIVGVDEAGRGPVLGPLVVAGVAVEDEGVLRDLGVKDSKKLTPAKREALAARIREVASAVAVRVVHPAELDERMARITLNALEVEEYAGVLRELSPPVGALPPGAFVCYVDACDTDAARFGTQVGALVGPHATLVSAHKADDKFPCVSAASIIAKTTRDALVAALSKEYGCNVGSGYSSDPYTVAFLKDHLARTGDLPACARKRWETCRKLLNPNRTLLEFGGRAR